LDLNYQYDYIIIFFVKYNTAQEDFKMTVSGFIRFCENVVEGARDTIFTHGLATTSRSYLKFMGCAEEDFMYA